MKIILIALFCGQSFSARTQMVKFNFKVYDPVIIDTGSNFYAHSNLEYSYYRINYSDSIFREKGLLSRDTSNNYKTDDLFKKRNKKWFIKHKSKWIVFFDNGKSVKDFITIDGLNYKLKWKKTIYLTGCSSIYKLTLVPIGFTSSGNNSYYFTYEDGIIGIRGHDVFLVRSDKLSYKFFSNISSR